MSPELLIALADFVLVVHFGYVAFVVLGLVVIWIGYFLRWQWVRAFWFRAIHVAAMGIVLAEALIGMTCPLTTWERQLREAAGQASSADQGFIQEWVTRLMFFDLPLWVFTVMYAAVFLIIVLTFVLVPPRWSAKSSRSNDNADDQT